MSTSQYQRGSIGHVLHHLREWGIIETIAGSVMVGDGAITYGGEEFAKYKYFDGIEQPLFRFQNEVYMRQHYVRQTDDSFRPDFKLTLSDNDRVCLAIKGLAATPKLHDFVHYEVMTTFVLKPGYTLTKNSGAVFQSGINNKYGEFTIEFLKPIGAQAFVKYINESFIV